MKRQTTILTLLLVSLMMILTGCDTNITPQKGQKVKFSVSSKTGMKTKTSYSGAVTNNVERIDWVVGDKVRIISSDKNQVGTPSGAEYYDYTVASVGPNGQKSDASLADAPNSNGLSWNTDDLDDVTFYGVYPAVAYSFITNNTGDDKVIDFKGMTIPSEPTLTWTSGTTGNIGRPEANGTMANAYMIAAPAKYQSTPAEGQNSIHLDFYPIFNAFEIDLASKDKTLELTKVELISATSYLANIGTNSFYYSGDHLSTMATNGPSLADVYINSDESKTITVNLLDASNTGKSISSAANGHLHFTVLALPGNLTDITLAVTFKDPNNANATKTRKLKLQQNGSFITFPAFHKARITGLALDEGSNWQLTIDDQVLPWIADEQTTSFRNQIGITGRTPVSGYIETSEVTEPGGPVNWENYYTRLTVNCNVTDPCIVFTFTPTAPVGGYWRLSPEAVIAGSLNYFKVTVDDGINGESERLQGQVMMQPVNIFIRPTAEYLALDPAPVYSIIIHCDMSPSVTFDPLFSADSEFQRPYSDGRFGYYKFVIAK